MAKEELEKLDLMKKFKILNVAEYTTKYGDYYGLMFAGAEIATKELQKENAELKEVIDNDVDKKIYVQLAKKAELADVQKGQLTKAKDLLLRFVDLKNKPCAVGNSVNMLLYDNICAEVEQFLNEVER